MYLEIVCRILVSLEASELSAFLHYRGALITRISARAAVPDQLKSLVHSQPDSFQNDFVLCR